MQTKLVTYSLDLHGLCLEGGLLHVGLSLDLSGLSPGLRLRLGLTRALHSR